MRLFKATYKDRRGKVQESAKWYCEFRDHLEIVRRLPLYTDQKASAEAGRKIERLVALRMAGCEPDTELTRWVESLEGRLVGKLAEIGLLSPSRLSAARPLAELIESWEGALKAKGINRHPRRVVTPAEIAHLLVKTGQEPVRYGMTGPERALVYRLAVET
ncbi:MAG: hypothetical protein NTW87_03315, partial [Planctomycetota bacterium]|nr:hypothetical protein [Planctomycetota bacterium]